MKTTLPWKGREKSAISLTPIILAFILAVTLTTANAQRDNCDDPLGTVGETMNPGSIPLFENDLPVIKDLGLRIDATNGQSRSMKVEMNETTQDLLGTTIYGNYDTRVWGYKFPGLPTTYPGATIVAQKNSRLVVRWENKLPGHFLPVDASLHMAHPSTIHGAAAVRDWYDDGNVPTVAHLHGGHTESASDGLPEAWFTQKFDETGNYYVKKNYRYDNDQEAATLWYHDHALGITRLNVYAGLAGFYLLRDDNENALIADGVLPGGDYEIEIVIQDRLFDNEGQLFWPAYKGETPYSDFIDPETLLDPYPVEFPEDGGPTALAEFFGNVILVNGKAWPKLDVEPRKYRFRLLNGSDSRFYILKLDEGSEMMIIGTDDGLLENPVNVTELVFAPGERYDVVVDFSGLTGNNITMTNIGPDEPYGGGDPGDDFEESCVYTTGQIMQFQVTKPMSAIPNATVGVGSTLNTINWFNPAAADNANAPRQLVLFEGMDEFGRLQPMLGTMADGSQTWSEAITENPAKGATEIWEVFNATGDAHPIHLHLVKFQIMNREVFTPYNDENLEIEDNVEAREQVQHNSIPGDPSTYGIGGNFHLDPDVALVPGTLTPPEPYEIGWKDTFIVPPGQVGRVIAHFDRPGRYVWHCHILSHEDHEMMRPFHVGPMPQNNARLASTEESIVENFPNPFKLNTQVRFELKKDQNIEFTVFDIQGKRVYHNLDFYQKGKNAIFWDGFDKDGKVLQTGVYLYKLKGVDFVESKRLVISR